MKPLSLFALVLLAAYGAYAVALVVFHPRLVYPFADVPTDIPGLSPVVIDAADGTPVTLQVSDGEGPTVLFFMGNAGALAFFEPVLRQHLHAGRHVVSLEYRGGAGQPGSPSEAVLKSDALAAADWIAGQGMPFAVHGYSLGSGLAVHVAARREVKSVILEAPFSRACHLMAAAAFVPACYLPFVQRWDTMADADRVTSPVLILHGDQDTIIPPRESEALAAALPVSRRMIVAGAGHQDVGLKAASIREIDEFLNAMPGR